MAKEDQVVADGEVQVVAFKLRNEEYGFSILNVQEIKNLSDITRVPFAPDFIKGVVNLRGSVLPVIDLKKRLGLEDTPYTANTRIVIVQYDEVKSLYLMSGAYDLMVLCEARTLKELASFVHSRLSTIEGVTGTSTHFMLKTYKYGGMVFDSGKSDRRQAVMP